MMMKVLVMHFYRILYLNPLLPFSFLYLLDITRKYHSMFADFRSRIDWREYLRTRKG